MTHFESALELSRQIASGQRSSVALTEEALQKIEKTDSHLGAFLQTTKDLALKAAKAVDEKQAKGEKLPLLAGVPIAIKDNILALGSKTTCASKILKNYQSIYDATVTQKLHANGLPIVGKTNMDEFAMGSSTENSAMQLSRNPWNTDYVPGGSSGGSAVTVASNQVMLSLGSDTGGSVRQPASFCGIVGLKPTYGTVSRYGLVAFGSSLDQISPFAQNVTDLAAITTVISGFDPNDSTSLNTELPNYVEELNKPLEVKRIGVIQELMDAGLQPEVKAAMEAAAKTYEKMGIEVVPVSIPNIKYAVAAYYIVAPAEASSNLARFDGVRYGHRDTEQQDILNLYLNSRSQGFGPEVTRRIMLGTFTLSAGYYDAYYGKAQAVRQKLAQDFAKVFEEVDVLISPTAPSTAFKIGELVSDPVQMYLSDIATIPVNMVGIPALSIPCGFDNNKMPIGLQLIGPNLSEAKLMRTALAFETETGLKNLVPEAYQQLAAV